MSQNRILALRAMLGYYTIPSKDCGYSKRASRGGIFQQGTCYLIMVQKCVRARFTPVPPNMIQQPNIVFSRLLRLKRLPLEGR